MQIDTETGLLIEQPYRASPNQDERPAGSQLELIVIHNISLPPGQFGGSAIDDLFLNQLQADAHPFFQTIAGLRVSAHILIHRDGAIYQYVPFHRRAWHAGQSCYAGRSCCNDFSIGIELEGTDTLAYSEIQYQQLAALIRTLLVYYPSLSTERIVGHCDIAPERKTDPGQSFDWVKLQQLLN